jgi:hypothetical protein
MLALGVMACAGAAAKEGPAHNGSGGTATTDRWLATGTRVDATIATEISSRTNTAGETLHATVSHDIMDTDGAVVIPAGSSVVLTIAALAPTNNNGSSDEKFSLVVSSVTVNGQAYSLTASLEPVPYQLKGQGITGKTAAKIGVGTAIGAVAGQVIGKNTKSTVIGGAVGAVAGTAVAVHTAHRDVIVPAGTPIVFTLVKSLSISPR